MAVRSLQLATDERARWWRAGVAALLAVVLGAPAGAQDLGALAGGADDEAFEGVPDCVAVRAYLDHDVYAPGQTARIAIEMRVDPVVHVNAHVPTFDFLIPTDLTWTEVPEGLVLGEIEWPAGDMVAFEFTDGEKIAVYEGTQRAFLEATVPASAKPGDLLRLEGTFRAQGCTHVTCYAPQTDTVRVKIRIAEEGEEPLPANESKFERAALHGGDAPGGGHHGEAPMETATTSAGSLEAASAAMGDDAEAVPEECAAAVNDNVLDDKPLWFAIAFAFGAGLLLTLTPCVLPLVPVTIGYFSRQQDSGANKLALASLYVLGLALVYSALGTVAALTGSLFGSALQNPWVLAGIAAVLTLLALSMFGILPDIRLPSSLSSKIGRGKQGHGGALAMGAAMGVVAAPCVGPGVVMLLSYVATLGATLPKPAAAAAGFSVFFALALGLGAPFFAVGMGVASIRPGAWMVSVKKVFGFAILGVALWFLRPVLGATITEIGLVAILLAAGVFLFLHAKEAEGGGLRRALQGIATASLAAAVVLGTVYLGVFESDERGPLVEFAPYSEARVAEAVEQGRPVMIDFWAEWCIACKELEHQTFPDPIVQEAFVEEGYVLLQADLSKDGDPTVIALRDEYEIAGLPAIVFLDETGTEVRDLRLGGFESPDEFVTRVTCASRLQPTRSASR